MKKNLYKFMLRSWLMLLAVALPTVALAQTDDPGNVDNDESAAMARTKANAPTLQDANSSAANYFGNRRALVGKHCSVNRVINVVAVGSGTSGLENLTNEDLDDYATFPSVVSATVATSPTVSVRDMKYYYAAGTQAGFCIVASSGSSVLSLDLVKTYHIWFYKDGQRVDDQQIEEYSSGSGLKLSLIGIPGSDQACANLTATSTADFDEVALVQVGAVNASVASEVKIKYAFVGSDHDINITRTVIADYVDANGPGTSANWTVNCEANMPSPLVGGIPVPVVSSYCERAIDDNLTNTVPLVSAVQLASLAFKGNVDVKATTSDASLGEIFHKGDQVGFKYNFVQVADVLSLGVWVDITLFDKEGNGVQTTTISAEALTLSVASGGDQTVYIVADTDFSGAGIYFYTALGVLNLGSGFGVYGAFVRPTPTVDHECMINPTCDTNLCNSQTSFQLKANPDVNVTWTVESQPAANNGQCSVTSDGFVTGMYEAGEYKFRATAEDGCYEIITINQGTSADFVEPSPEHIFYDPDYALSFDLHGQTSANLLSISDLTGSENVLDGDITNYATYTAGLQLAGANGVLLGIKKTDVNDPWIYDGRNSTLDEVQIGFVVEMEQTAIGLDLLNTFQIRCFDDNGNKLYESFVEEAGVLGLGLIGNNDKSNLMRLSITVPRQNDNNQDNRISEIQLWKVGVLDLDVDDVKFYYGFWADPNDKRNNVVRDGATVVTYDNMGAIVNVGDVVDVAAVGCVTNNLSNIIDIDDELETYALVQKTVNAGSQEIIVKLGRTLDYRHQVGVVINKDIVALNVNLAQVVRVGTYYQGQDTGETSTSWNVLGANVIQGSDKVVLYLQPTTPYDEIHITLGSGLQANQTVKIYGILLRNDIDNDGVPDVRDNDSCTDGILNINVTKVCVGGTLTVTGNGTTETNYKLSLTDQGVTKRAIVSAQDGSIRENITTTEAGRFTLFFYDASDNLIGTADYTVYPTRTTWRATTNDTDWNDWDNWTNGSPYLCTDVIIPSNARVYPSLDGTVASGDEFGCDRIYFESRAAVEKVFKLNYTKAWVDVELQPNRYYMLSAPLKDMYTGDMFIPETDPIASETNYFTALTGSNYPQHRTSPRVWQRLYEKTATVKQADGNTATADIESNEVRWSKRFNLLNYAYGVGEGYSAWVQPDDNTASSFTFRFPKEQTAYNYFYESGDPSSLEETGLVRTNAYRLASQTGDAMTPAFSYAGSDHLSSVTHDRNVYLSLPTVTATAATATTTFLVGNPFMSHIDVTAFLAGNPDISAVQTYDGNTTSSANAVTATVSLPTIQPMEAFFVTATTAGTELDVIFTEDMFLQEPATNASPANPMLLMTAQADGMTAQTVLVESEENTDVETLFDEDVRPQLALFTVKGDRAMDISTLNGEKQVPLGLYLQKPQTVKLSFQTRGDFDLTQYVLVDRLTGLEYSLDKAVELDLDGTAINRFVLRNSTTAIDDLVGDDALTVLFNDRKATVTSRQADIERIEVYSVDGKLLHNVGRAAARQMTVDAATNIGMLKIYRKGQKPAVRKFIVK